MATFMRRSAVHAEGSAELHLSCGGRDHGVVSGQSHKADG